jgi:hypothetical protein
MLIPTEQALTIDIRSSAEVMLYGVEERADAHIPYHGSPVDEWNMFKQSFLTHGNTFFVNSIFELISDYGLYRDSLIVLIAKSLLSGLRAASLLQVAGYKNIRVEIREGNSDRLVKRDRGSRKDSGSGVGSMDMDAYTSVFNVTLQ